MKAKAQRKSGENGKSGGGPSSTPKGKIPVRDAAGNAGDTKRMPAYKLNGDGGVRLRCNKCGKSKKGVWQNHPTALHDKAVDNPNFDYAKECPDCPVAKFSKSYAAAVKGGSSTSDAAKKKEAGIAELRAKEEQLWQTVENKGRGSPEGSAALTTLRTLRAQFYQNFG